MRLILFQCPWCYAALESDASKVPRCVHCRGEMVPVDLRVRPIPEERSECQEPSQDQGKPAKSGQDANDPLR